MDRLEIFVHDDSNDYEYEFGTQKGYWDNVYVKKNDKIYRVNIISLERLIQECQSSLQWAGCYIHDSNLVVIDKATKANIVKTLSKQNEMGFFENLAMCSSNGEILCDKNEEHWLSGERKAFKLDELHKIY